jgi:hypothetical protein
MDQMSAKQVKRLDAARRIQEAALTAGQAARVVGLSSLQMRRLLREVEKRGAKGLVHGNAGEASAPAVTDERG